MSSTMTEAMKAIGLIERTIARLEPAERAKVARYFGLTSLDLTAPAQKANGVSEDGQTSLLVG